MLANPTVKAASESCGISETQIYSRLRDPVFKEKYDEARRGLLASATAALQAHLSVAVETMYKVCADPKASAQTRLNAADMIVRNSLKLTEQNDILTRLNELERLAREDL